MNDTYIAANYGLQKVVSRNAFSPLIQILRLPLLAGVQIGTSTNTVTTFYYNHTKVIDNYEKVFEWCFY